MPVAAPQLGHLRPDHLGDAGRVERQLAVGGRLGEQRVVDPDVGDEVRGLVGGLDALPAAHDLSQPLGCQLLAAGLGGHVGVGREEVAEAATAGQTGSQQQEREEDRTTHGYSS